MDLLRWNEVVRQLGVAPSTARYWRDMYAEYVSVVGDGPRRRYRPEAVDVLAFVRDCMAEGLPMDEVGAALAGRFAREVDARPQDVTEPPQGAAILAESIRAAVADAHAEQNRLLREEIAHLRAESAERDAELRALLDERLPAPRRTVWEGLKRRLGMI